MPGILVVRNWERFQHYKHRSPPWIRLHRSLLDNRDYRDLPLSVRAILSDLWLLASESGNATVADCDMLAWRLRLASTVLAEALQVLVDTRFIELRGDLASTVLAPCVQPATTETERETESETEKSKAKSKSNTSPEPQKQNGNGDYRELIALVHSHLWKPDGLPPVGTSDHTECAMMQMLLTRNLDRDGLAIMIEGLGYLSRCLCDPEYRAEWLEGHKVSLKVLFKARSGVRSVRDLARMAYWYNHGKRNGSKRQSAPERIDALATIERLS